MYPLRSPSQQDGLGPGGPSSGGSMILPRRQPKILVLKGRAHLFKLNFVNKICCKISQGLESSGIFYNREATEAKIILRSHSNSQTHLSLLPPLLSDPSICHFFSGKRKGVEANKEIILEVT
uniref:Uncharacterized protein n=1 Tax=Micrurus lemniscatus lemniscatus TaxID=129467 RepID=A0A2D4J2C1_MICLE